MVLGGLICRLLQIHVLPHQCQYHQYPWLCGDVDVDGGACVEQVIFCRAITMMGF